MGSHEEDAVGKSDSTTEEVKSSDNVSVKNGSKPNSPLPMAKSLVNGTAGTSRYGRTLKPKSPSSLVLEFPKACIP